MINLVQILIKCDGADDISFVMSHIILMSVLDNFKKIKNKK